jgi:transposase-like protein
MAKWRRHTVEFKRQAAERMKTCENIHALARELNLERKLLSTWKYQFEGRPEARTSFLPNQRTSKEAGQPKLHYRRCTVCWQVRQLCAVQVPVPASQRIKYVVANL